MRPFTYTVIQTKMEPDGTLVRLSWEKLRMDKNYQSTVLERKDYISPEQNEQHRLTILDTVSKELSTGKEPT